MMSQQAQLILDARASLGEGPIWHQPSQTLYWVDITGKRVHAFDPVSKNDRVIQLDTMVGTVVARKSGGLMLSTEKGFAALDLKTEKLTYIVDPESDKPGNRFNDGKCDPAGRFWAGTMPYGCDKPTGALYRLDCDLSCHKLFENVTVSNGIIWTQDRKTMYYIDTPTVRVDAFDYDDATGNITGRRTVITFANNIGFPDGMTIDTDGNLWIGFWAGFAVRCFDPRTGKQLHQIDVPVPNVTACAFGGKNLDQLYITTARDGTKPEVLAQHAYAGSLFLATPNAKGVVSTEFAG